MKQGHASRTAEQNALFRALESTLPERDRLFDDPLAHSFLTWPLTAVLWLARVPRLGGVVPWYIDRRWPGVRSSVVARTSLIDDVVMTARREQVNQLVILGAGFDSRPYRLAALRDIAVFEVDHPDTQEAKRRVLRRALQEQPTGVRFVPCDFKKDDLGAVMAAAGYQASTRAFILWEGVTNYLTEEAVDATLRWCAGQAPDSILLFTYVHRDVLTRPETFLGADRLFASLEKAGERLSWGIRSEELPVFLAQRGLHLESDVGAADYRERYFGAAATKMRGHEFYHVAIARVGKHDRQERLGEVREPREVEQAATREGTDGDAGLF
jgi:methyltransferase (TIGR00027 family)